MKKIGIVFALGLFVMVTVAFPTQDQATVTARGVVTNPVTGESVPGATVKLGGPNPPFSTAPLYTALTDDAGRFTIGRVVPGKYRALVEKKGFISPSGFAENDSFIRGRLITVADGALPGNLILLPLIRTSRLSGRVLDAVGAPLGPAIVTVWEKGYTPNGRSSLVSRAQRLVDDQGNYEVEGLRPGEYYVRVGSLVRNRDFVNAGAGGPLIPLTYYPGVAKVDQAVPVRLTEGMNSEGIFITVSPAPVFSITMKLESAMKLPPFLFQIGDFYDSLVVDPLDGGRYAFRNIPAGAYDLEIRASNWSHRVHVNVVDRDVDLKTVNLDSQVSVPGRYHNPERYHAAEGDRAHFHLKGRVHRGCCQ